MNFKLLSGINEIDSFQKKEKKKKKKCPFNYEGKIKTFFLNTIGYCVTLNVQLELVKYSVLHSKPSIK